MSELPIHNVLPDLLAALRAQTSAVLVAPPGAGKTTAVAPALLGEDWCSGSVILLSPRRVAARAAAERMADLLGERAGETAGYLTRLDTKRSGRTRILVMTEAIFVATILADPELAGVSAVLFDEAHERHLDSDLGLALAIESASVLREDLRLVVMSATIDGAQFADLLGKAPVIESEGKAHPLRLRWLGARPELRLDAAMADAIVTAWREEEGDILAFLPGVGEIERTRERLAERLPAALVLPLHGQCEPAAQRAAIRRDAEGRRRIVLATAIAETSLTLDGVSVVVDAGLSRRAEYDKAAGVSRLVTHRASQAAAAQRAGRAARQAPGVAFRLWEEAAHASRAPFDPPEMLTCDLAPLLLVLAQWGSGDPAQMAWIDTPPAAAMASARARLEALGALDGEGRITAHGRAMARLPMDPPLAHMLLYAADHGAEEQAAWLALLLQERGLGGRGEDLLARLERWASDRSARAEASRKLAGGWAKLARGLVGAGSTLPSSSGEGRSILPSPSGEGRSILPSPSGEGLGVGSVLKARRRVQLTNPTPTPPLKGRGSSPPPAILLAEAFPDNIARRRDSSAEVWLTAGGRGLSLDPASPLARAEWLAVGEAQGQAKGARITGAMALDASDLASWLGHRMQPQSALRWLAGERRVEAMVETRLGAITVSKGPDPAPDDEKMRALLCEKVRDSGLELLKLGTASTALLVRAGYASIDELSPGALLADLEQWLGPLLTRRLDDTNPQAMHQALLNRLGHDQRQRLDRLVPSEWTSPIGTRHAIDYGDEGGPSVELRVQALFGLDRHPQFGSPPQPLLLRLTSPGGKPIQTTRDLPQFWRGSWRDVVREMKGRYPRHRWPDEPWAEVPSLKTKNALEGKKRS